jgi:hypothetical protein
MRRLDDDEDAVVVAVDEPIEWHPIVVFWVSDRQGLVPLRDKVQSHIDGS